MKKIIAFSILFLPLFASHASAGQCFQNGSGSIYQITTNGGYQFWGPVYAYAQYVNNYYYSTPGCPGANGSNQGPNTHSLTNASVYWVSNMSAQAAAPLLQASAWSQYSCEHYIIPQTCTAYGTNQVNCVNDSLCNFDY